MECRNGYRIQNNLPILNDVLLLCYFYPYILVLFLVLSIFWWRSSMHADIAPSSPPLNAVLVLSWCKFIGIGLSPATWQCHLLCCLLAPHIPLLGIQGKVNLGLSSNQISLCLSGISSVMWSAHSWFAIYSQTSSASTHLFIKSTHDMTTWHNIITVYSYTIMLL